MWRLAINNLAGRKGRNVLLVLAMLLATALTTAGGALLATLQQALQQRLGQVTGLVDLEIQHRFNARFDAAVLAEVRSWPQVALAAGRAESAATVHNAPNFARCYVIGIEPAGDAALHPHAFLAGRAIDGPGQIVIEESRQLWDEQRQSAPTFASALGDRVTVMGRTDVELTVVGVVEQSRLSVLQVPQAYVALADLARLEGASEPVALNVVQVRLRVGEDADAVAAAMADRLPAGLVFRTPAAASSGISRQVTAARLATVAMSGLVLLSAALLILTTQSTIVMQRQRELAILRCIGTTRRQLALAEVTAAALLAGLAASVGAPLGLLLGWAVFAWFGHLLHTPFVIEPAYVAMAMAATVAVAMGGAAYPALRAARVQPLEALGLRSKPTRRRSIVLCAALGLLLIVVDPLLWRLPWEIRPLFYLHLAVGLPLLFIGFFLLSVPVFVLLAHGVAAGLGGALRLPGHLLRQTLLATPMRHGFTAAATMVGLALLIAVWTTGHSIFGGYFGKLRMPDAFVHTYFPLAPQQEAALAELPAVTGTCGVGLTDIAARNARLDAAGLGPAKITFISFDPAGFIAMIDIEWVQGDPVTALEKFQRGDAVLVAREFLVSQGLGVGDTLIVDDTLEGTAEFEIVGVIASPGLDLATQYFRIRRDYVAAAFGSVFGTRADAARYFGNDRVHLLLMSLDENVSDAAASAQIRAAAPYARTGLSREILEVLSSSLRRFLAVPSAVAVLCLLIAGAAVANLIAAGIAARRFEYGVLRAIGASRGLLARLLFAETFTLALTGCVIGAGLGLELAWLDRLVRSRLVGITYDLTPPWDVIAWACLGVIVMALLAALPAALRLHATSPRAMIAQ